MRTRIETEKKSPCKGDCLLKRPLYVLSNHVRDRCIQQQTQVCADVRKGKLPAQARLHMDACNYSNLFYLPEQKAKKQSFPKR